MVDVDAGIPYKTGSAEWCTATHTCSCEAGTARCWRRLAAARLARGLLPGHRSGRARWQKHAAWGLPQAEELVPMAQGSWLLTFRSTRFVRLRNGAVCSITPASCVRTSARLVLLSVSPYGRASGHRDTPSGRTSARGVLRKLSSDCANDRCARWARVRSSSRRREARGPGCSLL